VRPLPALAAALAVVAAASAARAIPGVPFTRGPVLPPAGNGFRDDASIRITPLAGREPGYVVDVDIHYAEGSALPQVDSFPTGYADATDVVARADDGRDIRVLRDGLHTVVFALTRNAARPPRAAHLSFKQPFPRARRYGWRVVTAELDWAVGALQVSRDVTTTVVVPEGVSLPGFECLPGDGLRECARTTPRRLEPIVVAATVPFDRLGLLLMLITVGGSVFGFEQMRRKRALELAIEARARAVTPVELPGGAYREPPPKAMGPVVDATEAWRALGRRAAALAAAAALSTAAVAALASGHSPWPMAWVTAAWIAIVGFAGALVVERM